MTGKAATKPPLVWIDMEMTGLDPNVNLVLEIATLVTDDQLNIIAEGPELVIHHPQSVFATMDDWNKEHHTKSGLWKRVQESTLSTEAAAAETLNFLKLHTQPGDSPLAGNSVWQDRRFLINHMPSIDKHLHYRIVDVSTIKELVSRWYAESFKFRKKDSAHRALQDIRESIEELKHYRSSVFRDA